MPLNDYPTWEITSVADQRRLLAEPAAVLCVWFEWSMPARLARGAVGHWHERWHLYSKLPVVPLYFLDGDRVPEIVGWVRDTLREGGGHGSVYVLKRGEVVLRVPSVL